MSLSVRDEMVSREGEKKKVGGSACRESSEVAIHWKLMESLQSEV